MVKNKLFMFLSSLSVSLRGMGRAIPNAKIHIFSITMTTIPKLFYKKKKFLRISANICVKI